MTVGEDLAEKDPIYCRWACIVVLISAGGFISPDGTVEEARVLRSTVFVGINIDIRMKNKVLQRRELLDLWLTVTGRHIV